jgi:(p)ppGpp synthase/HD superfamily hydrolase
VNSASHIVGYSDRVNHAFAFAAKHHDRQVRKGTALPYLTHPANVAVILTRYGRDEATVLAGILHDVVQDCVQEGMSAEDLNERIGAKFGEDTLGTLLEITERRLADTGRELGWEARRADCLDRLREAGEAARWVCAADKLHTGGTLVADLERTAFPESVWGRFAHGPEATVQSYRLFYERLTELGFRAPIMEELRGIVIALEDAVAAAGALPAPSRAVSARRPA